MQNPLFLKYDYLEEASGTRKIVRYSTVCESKCA